MPITCKKLLVFLFLTQMSRAQGAPKGQARLNLSIYAGATIGCWHFQWHICPTVS